LGVWPRLLSTNADALAPGCPCEGWGVGDNHDPANTISGWANEESGYFAIRPVSYSETATTATSVVDIAGIYRVTHTFAPSADPNLYEIRVDIQNTSGQTRNVRYRRVMDWDVEPTAFREYVTIGSNVLSAPTVVFLSDDGFAMPNPFAAPYFIYASGYFTDSGIHDSGAQFDFDLGPLDPGQTRTFYLYYGAAPSEDEALSALHFVQAQVYSLGEPSTPDGPSLGTPNTFMFGYRDPQSPGIQTSGMSRAVAESSAGAAMGENPLTVVYDPNPNQQAGTP
jgi:hypothetical protein